MIDLGNVVLDGPMEALVRDNVSSPDSGLLDKALEQFAAPYREASYQRAAAKYAEVAESGTGAEKNALPLFTDQDAMIVWFISQPDYKNAATIEQERVAAEAEAKLAKANKDIQVLQNRITIEQAGLGEAEEDSAQAVAIQETINDLNALLVEAKAAKLEAEEALSV
jgi:hypothetical protein